MLPAFNILFQKSVFPEQLGCLLFNKAVVIENKIIL
jgi:hypothetical protein